ncbi:hypothetical protein BU16DRAFT_585780 [Lophium mytilinum]|uniref:Uncharacterized protein n=1 Tax=Lophium mytilinum TaxID=390894 RepID=A0A6A6QEY8_9PEZI|nr:hypothetical protein BU16DRAFT_585780 [Lophium mytilinum]
MFHGTPVPSHHIAKPFYSQQYSATGEPSIPLRRPSYDAMEGVIFTGPALPFYSQVAPSGPNMDFARNGGVRFNNEQYGTPSQAFGPTQPSYGPMEDVTPTAYSHLSTAFSYPSYGGRNPDPDAMDVDSTGPTLSTGSAFSTGPNPFVAPSPFAGPPPTGPAPRNGRVFAKPRRRFGGQNRR